MYNNLDSGDIIGFSNIYPNTNKIQDRGYDFILNDKILQTSPRKRGDNINDVRSFDYAECDLIMGCAMYIKKDVI